MWPEAVVYTYTVGAIAAAVRLLTPLDGMHTFSTLTNVAYLAVVPATIDTAGPNLLSGLHALVVIQGCGSLAHHARNCKYEQYRVLDHAGYLALYLYLACRGAWACIPTQGPPRPRLRNFVRLCAVVAIAGACVYYRPIKKNADVVVIPCGFAAGLFALLAMVRVQRTASIAAALAHAAIILGAYGCAYLANRTAGEVWAGDTLSYDVPHGLWHLFTANAQFVLLHLLATNGASAPRLSGPELSGMIINVVVLGLGALALALDACTAAGVLTLSIAAVVAGALCLLAEKRGAAVRPLSWLDKLSGQAGGLARIANGGESPKSHHRHRSV